MRRPTKPQKQTPTFGEKNQKSYYPTSMIRLSYLQLHRLGETTWEIESRMVCVIQKLIERMTIVFLGIAQEVV